MAALAMQVEVVVLCGCVSQRRGHQCSVRVVLLRLNVDGRISMSLWCTVTVYHKTQS